MSKTTRKTYSPQFKMRVALEAAKEQEQEEAAGRRHDDALKTIGQLTVERDFLQRFCDDNGYSPEAPGSRR